MIAWLPSVVLAFAMAEPASPAPSPAAPTSVETALPEIGRVRANSACQAIIEHARVAITDAVRNDRRLFSLATVMDRISPNATVGKTKTPAVDVLAAWASSIESSTAEGQAAVDRLRALATASTDPIRKRELKAFADALAGALARQKDAAHEVQRGLFLIGARTNTGDMRALEDEDPFGAKTAALVLEARQRAPTDAPKLRDLAATLAERIKVIKEDEHEGVRHEVGATNGC